MGLGLTATLLPTGYLLANVDSERDIGDWQAFRGRWIDASGRIIDSANQGISHSEGQGTGLMFSVRHEDRSSFNRILGWTRANLRHPGDALHAWRYRPGVAVPVDDPNNASDGDLLIAWGLVLAWRQWGDPQHRRQALAICQDLIRSCTLRMGSQVLLLPGQQGFVRADHVVVNLSYWLFGALRVLNEEFPDPVWAALEDTGLALMRQARFGRWGLPPDWLAVPRDGSSPYPATPWPARFSWDAVRVPLHLIWGGHADHPVVGACADLWGDPSRREMPAWIDLRTGAPSPYAATTGILAVAQLTLAARAGGGRHAALPRVSEAGDYYAAKLVMMSHYAWAERGLTLAEEPPARIRPNGTGPRRQQPG